MTTSIIPDPIQAGIAKGWKIVDAAALAQDRGLEADVVIVGSGAGGGVTAEILARAGLSVSVVEEGALKSSRDFRMREADAYPSPYQESAARKTSDKGINILQGRTVGGSTVVNWTSSFRTPPATLDWWRRHYALPDATPEAMAPWFAMMEERLHIADWPGAPNENNDILRRGAGQLGIPTDLIRRNVKGCWNLGYCSMGCPTNAKQSMLVTTIPAALERGALLVTRARADRFVFRGERADELLCQALDAPGILPTGRVLRLRARHFVVAGGAINLPAPLLRSRAPDPSGLLGRRTFLDPTIISAAFFPQRVEAWAGAPQTVYSDHYLASQPDGPIGYKLEAPPLHPLLLATTLNGFGETHAAMMRDFPHLQGMLALLRDGFHEGAPGGTVGLRRDGSPELDYPMTDYLWDGARRALLSMAEIQFAAGASSVQPAHEMARRYGSWREAKAAIADLPQGLQLTPEGRYRGLSNLSVHDGSLFPTSLGANPQLTIYGLAAKLASGLAASLGGRIEATA